MASMPAAELEKLTAMIRRARADPVYELEARIGQRKPDGKFVPGISRSHMDNL